MLIFGHDLAAFLTIRICIYVVTERNDDNAKPHDLKMGTSPRGTLEEEGGQDTHIALCQMMMNDYGIMQD